MRSSTALCSVAVNLVVSQVSTGAVAVLMHRTHRLCSVMVAWAKAQRRLGRKWFCPACCTHTQVDAIPHSVYFDKLLAEREGGMAPDADSLFLFHGVIKLIPLSPSRRKGLCFPCRLPHRNHFGEATIRTTGIRGKVGMVAYPLYPLPRLLPEVDELNDLGERDNTAVLFQPLVHEIQLLADFDNRKDTHIIFELRW
jgi:hypothetical protein